MCRRQVMLLKNHQIYELITEIVNLRISQNHMFKCNDNLLFMIEELCFYKLSKVSPKIKNITPLSSFIQIN